MKINKDNIRIFILVIWLLYGFSVMYGSNLIKVISLILKSIGISL